MVQGLFQELVGFMCKGAFHDIRASFGYVEIRDRDQESYNQKLYQQYQHQHALNKPSEVEASAHVCLYTDYLAYAPHNGRDPTLK